MAKGLVIGKKGKTVDVGDETATRCGSTTISKRYAEQLAAEMYVEDLRNEKAGLPQSHRLLQERIYSLFKKI